MIYNVMCIIYIIYYIMYRKIKHLRLLLPNTLCQRHGKSKTNFLSFEKLSLLTYMYFFCTPDVYGAKDGNSRTHVCIYIVYHIYEI